MNKQSCLLTSRCLFLLTVLLLSIAVGLPRLVRGQKPPDRAPLVVVIDDNYPPYVFRDASGTLRGILPDQWALWEQKTGVQVDLRAMEWGEAQRLMQEGRSDVIDTMFFTEERGKLFSFTPPYVRIEVPVYAHKTLGGISDVASLKGFTVGVKAGDAVIDHLTRQGIESLRTFPSYEAIILAAKNEEIKVFSVDQPAAVYFLYKHGIANKFLQSFVLYTGELHRAVQKHRPDLLRLVQDGFDGISRREYRSINRRWTGTPFLLKGFLSQWVPAILGVAASILALVLGNILLSRRVRAKTSELRTTLEELRQSLAALQKSDEALQESHELLMQFMRHSPIYTFIKEVTATESRTLMVSDNFQQMVGLPASEIIGKTMTELFLPDLAAKMSADDWTVVTKGEVLKLDEEVNGRLYTTIKFPIVRGGKALLAGYTIDITDLKRAEKEKEALQEQLMHAQKIESIGRLAGGVAHDFSNMLQAILGYTDIALEQVSPDQPLRADILEIQKAAQRSIRLTRKLQTFARKQSVAPQVMDINGAVEGMSDMLRRLIGEDIHLVWRPGRKLGIVLMDPGQFDQVVVNLCINARDAIGKAGHITIKTDNVVITPADADPYGCAPGAYVLLAISDDGSGMSPEARDRIFEPFFTTKPISEGTGLGLSIVYGIVKQNGGGIRVDSELGKGSVFSILLPLYADKKQTADEPATATGIPEPATHETILLVDDETSILHATRRLLERLGYRVLATDSPHEALRLFADAHEPINLLLTDVIMPGMTGPELVRQILKRQPTLKYLFMSGHTANLLEAQGLHENSTNCIQKPFSLAQLAQKVRDALSQPSPAEPSETCG